MYLKRRSKSFILASVLTALIGMPFQAAAGSFTASGTTQAPNVLTEQYDHQAEIVPGELIVKYKNGGSHHSFSASSFQSATPIGDSGATKLKLKAGEDVYAKIDELQADPNVEFAQPVYVYHATVSGEALSSTKQTVAASVYSSNDPLNAEQWGLYAVDAEDAWAAVPVSERQQIVVAVVDTGVQLDHEDLVGNFYEVNGHIVGSNFANDNKPSTDFNDYNGHGTHVAGIIGASADNGIGVAGIASGVKIMPVRVLNSTGAGDSASIAAGIDFAAANGADVINLSLASESPDPLVEDAVNNAMEHGVVVVAATGNESNNYVSGRGDLGPGESGSNDLYQHNVDYPAAYDGVIGVGAVDWYDDLVPNGMYDFNEFLIADFSNTGFGENGLGVDVVAPGVDIWSTYMGNDYASMSGTSMATPFVSGLAALVLAHDHYASGLTGELRSQEVQRFLSGSALHLYPQISFGDGLISAGSAVTKPRIMMDWSAADNGDLTLNMDLRDATGTTVTDSVYSILLQVLKINDDGSPSFLHNETLTKDISSGRYTKTYNDLTVPGIYVFLANGGQLISNSLTLYQTPSAPAANPASGTYTGTQNVTLSSDSGAEIRYTLDGSDPTPFSTLYTGPITVDHSLTLKAFAYEHLVYSDIITYNYTINTNTGGGGSGGGGGGGLFIPPPPADDKKVTTDADGKSTLTVKVDSSRVLKDIQSSTTNIVIDASSDKDTAKLSVELSGEILQKATERSKPIEIKSNQVTFAIQPGTIKVSDPNQTIRLSADLLSGDQGHESATPPASQLVSGQYDFNLTVGDGKVSKFDQPITITINKLSSVKDPAKLGVYYFNEQSKTWEYVGGHAKTADAITFAASHFSTYAVMESDKTFKDIQNHWAKHDIEVMAAKQIAQGVGTDAFNPNGTITRAEFAALITRALSIKDGGSTPYGDVADDAWYADAVRKAYTAGIISGTSSTTFSPNAPVTREALATMLLNAYAFAAKVDLSTIAITQEVKYSDEGSVSSWARSNVRLANALNLMVGTDGMFKPQAYATRAEAISILKRLIDKLNE